MTTVLSKDEVTSLLQIIASTAAAQSSLAREMTGYRKNELSCVRIPIEEDKRLHFPSCRRALSTVELST
jgi:hypothetical protein